MAEDKKVVTKKTAARPAATAKVTEARATAASPNPAPAKPPLGVKKTATRAATPKPTPMPAARAATAKPTPMPAAPAARAMPDPKPVSSNRAAKASNPDTKSTPTPLKGTAAAKGSTTEASVAPATGPRTSAHPPLQEKPLNLQYLAETAVGERLAMIRDAAYYKAEKRGFAPGHETQDWAEAEREIDELLAKARQIYGV